MRSNTRRAAWCLAAGMSTYALPTAWFPASAAGASPTTGVTATPVLSLRRLPGWVAETVASQRLDGTLAAILGTSPSLNECALVGQGRRVMYSANPDTSLIPASNMKLLTATAAVDQLGAEHRFTTAVVSPRPGPGGVVGGNLYLVGGGDPLLRTAAYAAALGPDETVYTSLDRLAQQVRASGVKEITGSVIGDETRYDRLRTVPTWSPVYSAEGDVGPLSALEVNDGTAPSGPPPKTTSSAAALQAATSADPAVRAAATFAGLLRGDGVEVRGPPASGTRPAGLPVLTSEESPPLAAELGLMLTVSDDTAAELFTKELGVHATGEGTTAAGVAAIRADLANAGLPVTQLVGMDGSGLDRGDRATCNLLLADLERLGTGSVVAAGLPIAGQTGTLRTRMRGTPAAGRLRAKTGTLDDVIALSGFVLPAPGAVTLAGSSLGQPIAFSIVLDGLPSEYAGRAIADRVGVALAAYPQLPPLAQIAPTP